MNRNSTAAVDNRTPLYTVPELATYLGLRELTLYAWRSRGEGPPGVRVGGRVRYRQEDVDAWLVDRNGAGHA